MYIYFLLFEGMNIVHPPYVTSQYWLNKIDPDKVDVPDWVALEELHPCQFQSSMLKGCIPTAEGKAAFYSSARRKQIRRIYLAMVAEYDSMVRKHLLFFFLNDILHKGISGVYRRHCQHS